MSDQHDYFVTVAQQHAALFTADFLSYLPSNVHVYEAFEAEAKKIANRGFKRYSARTIVEVLRHHSAVAEVEGAWKLNDWRTPYLARLFAILNPESANLFEFRVVKSGRANV